MMFKGTNLPRGVIKDPKKVASWSATGKRGGRFGAGLAMHIVEGNSKVAVGSPFQAAEAGEMAGQIDVFQI